jgi:FtsP/CotA-like multicopper oxidase with cupredoxin domain
MDTVPLKDGDTLRLAAAPVMKILNGRATRMLAYNGSIPGPLIRVAQGASITVLLENRSGLPTSLHAHGVRMDAAYDGADGALAQGGKAVYTLRFPDAGIYWYHPHAREDYAMELGLYGNIHVTPRDSAFWKPVDREMFLMLDDVLVDSVGIAPFTKGEASHALMGRFGNRFLVNGQEDYKLDVRRNELVRFFVTNACNTRVLALAFFKGGTMKVVGSDNGPFETAQLTGKEYLAPGERMVAEAYFGDAGTDTLRHVTPNAAYRLATIRVAADSSVSGLYKRFFDYDTNAYAIASIDSFRADLGRPVDKELIMTVRMGADSAHPMAKSADVQHDPEGIEWEDHMGAANAKSNSGNVTWILKDPATGAENHGIHWTFKRGDRVKIRIRNDPNSMHPMPHPIHFHGQRFLVTAINGKSNVLELAWKDTYLMGKGEMTEILLDASNPGTWMAHCHIAEHLEASMMLHYTVE